MQKGENMKRVFLVRGKRTPFGKFGGSFQNITPVTLSLYSSREVIGSIGDKIDHIIFGNVIPSSTDTLYGGRHLALKLGMSEKTPAYTVNRLCGSGIQAIMDAKRLIQLNEAESVLVSGVENMSMAPHLTYGGRFGTKYGNLKTGDMLLDALTDQHINMPMALTAENLSERHDISRDECDLFSLRSHEKGSKAYVQGYFKDEVISVETKRGIVSRDEHLRENISVDDMKKLRPSFKKNGVVTPGTASGIVDGACSVLIASEKFCEREKLTPMAEIKEGSVIGVDPSIMGIGPVASSMDLLRKVEMGVGDIDLWEINEAFAGQVLACQKELKVADEKLNIWGGGIAFGHPLAASGVRISLSLAGQMKVENKKYGIATACIGGGQGISLLLENIS